MHPICSRRTRAVARALLCGIACIGARAAHAQGAAPGDTTVRQFGGGVYLFHYRPFDLAGAVAHTEVYAAYATADVRRGRWSLFGEARARDSKLRPWMNGTAWVQQAWVGYDLAPDTPGRGTTAAGPWAADSRLALRAGKLYQTLGRFWDGSFFGNLHYFDGLKLNPQFALEAAGRTTVAGGATASGVTLGYTVQYLANSDRVSGALTGRDFETLSGYGERDGWAARSTLGLPLGLTIGVSALSRGVADSTGATYRVPHVAVDGEWTAGPLVAYAEWTRRQGGDLPAALRASVAGSRADYWLAGAQLHRGRAHLRYNYSRAHYDALARTEWIHQPGVTLDLAREVHVLLEFDEWRARTPGSRAAARVDRSLDLVLQLALP